MLVGPGYQIVSSAKIISNVCSLQEGNPLLGSLAHHSQSCDPEGPIPSEGEMDVQPLDTSHSSDPDSNPSDLERIESSASSLSLASEHVQYPHVCMCQGPINFANLEGETATAEVLGCKLQGLGLLQ